MNRLVACALALLSIAASAETPVFRAGAVAVDISPPKYPVIIAGGFLEGRADRLNDPLFVRCIVLDDGRTKLAFAIVDTCMMSQALIDDAKQLAFKRCGIPVNHMMVSATHTHSAPAALACLGTRQDKDYAAFLPGKIAEGIVVACAKLQPAKIGWASIDDWEHTHNRRWIRQQGKEVVDPFGDPTGRANMHPGYLSPDIVGPSGPVDPGLSVVSIQTLAGKPLAVLANYSQHYFGSPSVSADYYGMFCKHLAGMLGQGGDGHGEFVCAMSQGTSGDLMWMDYGSPKKSFSCDSYAKAVATYAKRALDSVKHQDHVPLGIIEKTLALEYRVPDKQRLAWARPIAEKITDDLPKDKAEVYAKEALILNEQQRTSLKLQAIRIGDVSIATLPNEVYAITGLKLKAMSPFAAHFNIELANGGEGYIPPPEQHQLGGYTTWPARTAGLEVEAEPKIVETLLDGLEEVTGKKRRPMIDQHGPYAASILASKPLAYWRLNEVAGNKATNAVSGGSSATVSSGAAWFLPGPGSGSGIGAGQALTHSAFSGEGQINRALHLAGGDVSAVVDGGKEKYSIGFWFWLGEASGASPRQGTLVEGPGGEVLHCQQFSDHRLQVLFNGTASRAELRGDDWHFVMLVRNGDQVSVHLDGSLKPELTDFVPVAAKSNRLRFGQQLQGKLDEISVHAGAMTGPEIAALWKLTGVGEAQAKDRAERIRLEKEAAERARPPQFSASYDAAIRALKPEVHARLDRESLALSAEGKVKFSELAFAAMEGARLKGAMKAVNQEWSVSLWFRNETPNDQRAVTAYLFSRGTDGDRQAPGDHLGIGGNHRSGFAGRLIAFNGNSLDQTLMGKTVIPASTWNHVVMVREGARVRAWLNGESTPEIDGEMQVGAAEARSIYLGARSDMFAPLLGNLAQFALFDRALEVGEVQTLHAASGLPRGTPPLSGPMMKAVQQLDSLPLPPKDSMKKLRVRDGYEAQLVAEEPLVLDPVAFDWDSQGRMWVVEMADYPLGMDASGKAGGRIRVLSQPDKTGHYTQSTLFAEGLTFPTGILCWRDGIIVTAAPEILFLKDSNSDGKADVRQVLYSGFSVGNQQLRVNGLRWGMDGWVYCAAGGHHGNYNKDTQIECKLAGQKVSLGSRDFRFKPDTGEFDPQTGPAQFGRCRDDWGHWFGVQNSFPLWHYVLQDHYLRRNPHVIPPDPVHQLFARNPKVWPVSTHEKRFHSFDQAGHFTSACGIEVYRDEVLFGSEKLHAFTCEPFHNVVQHHVLEDEGVTFKARRDKAEVDIDFLASEDRWCRPVMVRTGPDGGIYVADMYRYMIEHPQWLPQKGKDELLPFYREGDNAGRIYRIALKGKALPKLQALSAMSNAQLVTLLASSNGWLRDRAQMELVWRKAADVDGVLIAAAVDGRTAQARATAAWTLELLGRLIPEIVQRLLTDPSPRVREQGLILAEKHFSAEVLVNAVALVKDEDAKVRLQLACSLGEWKDPQAATALASLLKRDGGDPVMVGAILSSATVHFRVLCKQAPDDIFPRLVSMAVAAWDEEALSVLCERMVVQNEFKDAVSQRLVLQQKFLHALQSQGTTLEKLLQRAKNERFASQLKTLKVDNVNAALGVAEDMPEGEVSVLAAVGEIPLLVQGREKEGYAMLTRWLEAPQVNLQRAAIEVLGRHPTAETDDLLIKKCQSATPMVKTEAVDALLSHNSGALLLLAQFKNGTMLPAGLVDVTTQARLLNHPDAKVKALSVQIFQGAAPSKRVDVVSKFKPALDLKGDAAKGKIVFAQMCIACHKLEGLGLDLGPDLRSVVQHTPDKLLNSILDPSAIIEPSFMAYHCTLKSGEQLYGVVASETSSSITLKLPGNVVRPILRSDITSLKSTQASLMPDGLEAALTVESLADLIAYLQVPKK